MDKKISIKKLLGDLEVPENSNVLDLNFSEGRQKICLTFGGSKIGYHGYCEHHRFYDPYFQLEELAEKDTSDQYAESTDFFYEYKGDFPCVIETDYNGINRQEITLHLFLPEGMKENIIFQAKQEENISFQIPSPLLQKWTKEISEKEKEEEELDDWEIFDQLQYKALVFSAHQFAKKYPDKNGVAFEIKDGVSALIRNGSVEFIGSWAAEPEKLIQIYEIESFYPIYANV